MAKETLNSDRQQKKHNKVHLLIISETGKVKSKKIPIQLVKWLAGISIILFILVAALSYLGIKNLYNYQIIKNASVILEEVERLKNEVKKQRREIQRLQDLIARLNRENQDLKQHIILRKARTEKEKTASPILPQSNGKLKAYQTLLSQIEHIDALSFSLFHIRDPQINVSDTVTDVSFKLYKDTLKKIYGRFILIGIHKPENPVIVGKVVAFPKRGVVNFRIHPRFGRYFKIEKQFLPLKVKLPHPEGLSRFSEFHILIYGMDKRLLFHEMFTAP